MQHMTQSEVIEEMKKYILGGLTLPMVQGLAEDLIGRATKGDVEAIQGVMTLMLDKREQEAKTPST
jgi:hypothetical protein